MSHYFEAAQLDRSMREFPLGEAFLRGSARLSGDELRARQERDLKRVVQRAFEVPFYRRHWGAVGLEPGDIRGLDDLALIPTFGKSDLMASIEACPPLGDYHGVSGLPGGPEQAPGQRPTARAPLVMHTTSGTTGTPQPLFYGPRDREIQNRLLARAYRLQGLRDDDVVHSVYGFGMVNGGHYIRETILHHTNALLLPAGTGLETPSEQQVQLMRRFGVTALLGFVDYLGKLAHVAGNAGIDPARDLQVRLISGHLGSESRDALSRAWGGAEVYDWYGVGDTGIIAAEGPDRAGLIVWEDAHLVEILDPESGAPIEGSQPGNLCVTTLFKDDVYPIVRFDTQDLTAWRGAPCEPVPAFRRIEGFLGRSDNMVKLRGINVYPTAIAAHLARLEHALGEYVCRVTRSDGQDEMTVDLEWRGERTHAATEHARAHLSRALGVRIDVRLVAPGATAELTDIERRQKPRRLVDER